MNQSLDNGVVCGIHVCVEREGTFSITVIGSITLGCDDPVLNSEQKEATKKVINMRSLHLCALSDPMRRHYLGQ